MCVCVCHFLCVYSCTCLSMLRTQPSPKQDDDMDMDMDMEIDEQPAPSEMQSNVREERKRSRQQANDTQFIICPTCKQSIPANEYSEHVRVELLKGKTVLDCSLSPSPSHFSAKYLTKCQFNIRKHQIYHITCIYA